MTSKVTEKSRYFGLDFLRTIAILTVLLAHASLFFPFKNYITHAALPTLGLVGVEIFFGLSGYLIGSILLKRSYGLDVFYIKRFMKILPPYLIFLFIIYLTSTPGGSFSTFLAHLFFLHNFYPDMAGYFPVSWSLSIEFWFYLLIPLLFYFSPSMSSKKIDIFTRVLAALLLITLGRVIYVLALEPNWEFGIHRFIPLRMDALLFGVLAAIINIRYPTWQKFILRPSVILTSFATAVGALVSFGYAYFMITINQLTAFKMLGTTIIGISVLVSLVVVQNKMLRESRFGLFNLIIRFISKISYSLYLTHLFVYLFIENMLGNGWVQFIIAFSTSIVMSWIVYITVEATSMKVSNAFVQAAHSRNKTLTRAGMPTE